MGGSRSRSLCLCRNKERSTPTPTGPAAGPRCSLPPPDPLPSVRGGVPGVAGSVKKKVCLRRRTVSAEACAGFVGVCGRSPPRGGDEVGVWGWRRGSGDPVCQPRIRACPIRQANAAQAVTVHTAGAGRGGAPHDCPGSLSGPKSARKDPDASSSLNHAGTPAPRSRRASRNGGSVPGPTPLQSPGSALDPACMGFTAATSRPAPRRPEGSRGGGGGLGGPGSAGHGPPRPPRGNRGGADAFLSVRGFDSSLSAEPSRNEGTFPRPPKVPFFPKTGRGEPCLLGQVRTPRTRKAPGPLSAADYSGAVDPPCHASPEAKPNRSRPFRRGLRPRGGRRARSRCGARRRGGVPAPPRPPRGTSASSARPGARRARARAPPRARIGRVHVKRRRPSPSRG